MRRMFTLAVVTGTAAALAGCVIPSSSRGVLEPASVTAPPSLQGEVAPAPRSRPSAR
jgi:hypothetical protein